MDNPALTETGPNQAWRNGKEGVRELVFIQALCAIELGWGSRPNAYGLFVRPWNVAEVVPRPVTEEIRGAECEKSPSHWLLSLRGFLA